jgi:hypothetical protein
MSKENVELVTAGYEAWKRGDIAWALRLEIFVDPRRALEAVPGALG